MIDEIFRKKFNQNLFENKFYLKEKSVLLVEVSLDNYNRVILSNIATDGKIFNVSRNNALDNINKVFNDDKNFSLQLRNDNWNVFRENEIKVIIENKKNLALHSDEEKRYRVDKENFQYECEEEFWLDSFNVENYRKISNFNCFTDFEFELSEKNKILKSGNYFDYVSWCDFILNTLLINFPDFKFKNENETFRFTKALQNGLEFGFEYNNRKLMTGIKKGIIQLPDYFNIIVFNNSFDKKTKSIDYVFKHNDCILSLGILGNPFFYHPTIPLKSFSTIDLYHYGDFYPNNIEPKSVRKYELIGSDKMKLLHCNEYGEKLKKHCFFYLDLLKYSTKDYLDYLELCINETY